GIEPRLGASCLAQVFGQVGDVPPDLDDPQRLRSFFNVMQALVDAQLITAYHDRSDGGAIISALEMAFASGLGLELAFSQVAADPFRALFAEELGAIIEVPRSNRAKVTAMLAKAGLRVHTLGAAVPGERIRISHGGEHVIDAARSELRARWSHVTHQMARR